MSDEATGGVKKMAEDTAKKIKDAVVPSTSEDWSVDWGFVGFTFFSAVVLGYATWHYFNCPCGRFTEDSKPEKNSNDAGIRRKKD